MYIIVDEVWKPTLSYKGIAFISAELSIVLIPDFLSSSIRYVMYFNVTEIKQSLSLFQLPVLLNLRKTFIDLTN